jgi:opacity protein-like surface antigen
VASAEPKETGPYFTFTTNYALDYEGDYDGLRDDSINGLNLSARLGYDLNKYFGVELESGWSVFDFQTDEGAVKSRLGVANITDAGSLHVVPLLFNVTAKYPMQQFVPYAVGGTGVFFYEFENSNQMKNTNAKLDIDSAAFGFKLGGGLDYYLTENLALNFESGFWFVNDPDLVIKDTSSAEDILSNKADVDTWYVGGGLKYKF